VQTIIVIDDEDHYDNDYDEREMIMMILV